VPAPPGLPIPSFRASVHQHLGDLLDQSARAFPEAERLRIDLHCHDRNSDVTDELWGRILRIPESWLEPRKLYKTLRSRGATAWTITNHNNARSCWELLEQGVDILSAAEWTCLFPEYDVSIHILVYGFTPQQEPELERRRRNVYDFLRYCRNQELPVVQPHPLFFYARNRQPPREIFEKFAILFERFEVCNGQREAWQNLLAWEWVRSLDRERLEGYARKHGLDPWEFCAAPWTKAIAGGSDDHIGVLAGLTGSWLQVPGLEQRLAAGASRSELAMEALRAKRMQPFGRPADEQNLSAAILDYLAQAAIHGEDPGLLRVLLHKGNAADKLWCLGITNGLAELRRHRYTFRFLKAWHACLQGEKPGVMLRLTVNKDYRPFLGHLERIAKVRRKHPETLPETLKDILPEMFHGMMRLMLKRARKGLAPIAAQWEAEGSGRIKFDHWVDHLEVPSHFRMLLGLEKLTKPRSMSALQVATLLDDLTFPSLMATLLAGATAVATHTLNGGRELLNDLAESCGGTAHPRRVLWLTDTFFDANGVSSALQSVLVEIRRRDLPVDFLICHAKQEAMDHLRVVRPLESFSLPGFGEQAYLIPDLLEVLRLVQDGGYDRLIVSTEGAMGWVGLLLKHALRIQAHFFVHTDWLIYLAHNASLDQHGLDRVRRLLRWFYRQWDGLFVLNRQHREWLAGVTMEIPPERLHLTAHWAAPEYHPVRGVQEELPGVDSGQPILVFAGRLSEEKGVLDVIEAWKRIRARVPKAQLVFAGRGPAEAKLRALAPEARFTGWVDRDSLARWFRASTLLIFPSRFDTFGCAVLEALSCGLPVACYPVKGPADLVEDGVNGLVCNDPGHMAERIVAYLAAPIARREAYQHHALGTALRYQAADIMDRMLADVGLSPSHGREHPDAKVPA
jgi:glycosyltransferase involved in cell wall biosynthesis